MEKTWPFSNACRSYYKPEGEADIYVVAFYFVLQGGCRNI